MENNRLLIVLLSLFFFLCFLGGIFFNNNSLLPAVLQTPSATPANNLNIAEPKSDETGISPVISENNLTIDPKKQYSATLKTGLGDIVIELFVDRTPITVNNFVALARKNFYNKTVFHRVIKDFMIQGGDPNGNGTGGPGYTFADEPFAGDYQRGTVAMANAGPNTNGSQFFIMQKDNPNLPKNYVIFGKVISGIEVIDQIASAPVIQNDQQELSRPANPVAIASVIITEK
jgi:cyclophilin family peptidyl-prolyl cis-trans isomerase